jgi:hypothetical protein
VIGVRRGGDGCGGLEEGARRRSKLVDETRKTEVRVRWEKGKEETGIQVKR